MNANPYRLIVAGGRHFSNYSLMKQSIEAFIAKYNLTDVMIVSGTASGADQMGERYASYNDLPVEKHPANWTLHAKAAGPIRNREMADVSQGLVAFWDGKSKGTKNMIETATKLGLDVEVVLYGGAT